MKDLEYRVFTVVAVCAIAICLSAGFLAGREYAEMGYRARVAAVMENAAQKYLVRKDTCIYGTPDKLQ